MLKLYGDASGRYVVGHDRKSTSFIEVPVKRTRGPEDTSLLPQPTSQTLSGSVLWTVGHSTRPVKELIGLLQVHGIQLLIDVRIIPFSRRNPQFNQEALAHSLHDSGLQYRHMPELGGRRKSKRDSMNQGWKNQSFRGYADYMQTQKFWDALSNLADNAQISRSVIMCAEAVPWRCHRTLIADALTIRGWTVQHIMSAHSSKTHTLTPFARPDAGRLTYPSDTPNSTLRLF